MSSFTPLQAIASAVVEEIAKLPGFAAVEYLQATTGSQVYARCQALVRKPCALVTIGSVSVSPEVLTREFRIMVFVIDNFQKGFKREADTLWELSERVGGLFLPRTDENGNFTGAVLAGANILLESAVPIESPDNILCCCVNLVATDFLLDKE